MVLLTQITDRPDGLGHEQGECASLQISPDKRSSLECGNKESRHKYARDREVEGFLPFVAEGEGKKEPRRQYHEHEYHADHVWKTAARAFPESESCQRERHFGQGGRVKDTNGECSTWNIAEWTSMYGGAHPHSSSIA